jgi:chaperonin GroES
LNKSGIHPVEYKVLIKPVKVEEKTSGGIIMPDGARDKVKFALTKGELVECGAIAFTDPNWLDRPKVGQTVMFERYAGGNFVMGDDGEEYRLMPDKEIVAILGETNG